MPLVSIGIVTWNSGASLERCLEAVRRQTHRPTELLVVDNASTDDTWSLIERLTRPDERLRLERNTGFSAAHNRAIDRSTGVYYLALNPDVYMDPGFVERLAGALDADSRAGAASGKLVRDREPGLIDSTGLFMLPSQRHLDRGGDEKDHGQYDRAEYVFGASGAAAFYRRAMLDDVRVNGEVFDEDFFAYREDADLAWRAQLFGWGCRYEPTAVARHVRRVTPERRASLSADVNRCSVRNRFLLRLKNQTGAHARRFFAPALLRDLQVVGFVLLREWSSIPGLVDVIRLAPRTLAKRRAIMARRRASEAEIARWFEQQSQALSDGVRPDAAPAAPRSHASAPRVSPPSETRL